MDLKLTTFILANKHFPKISIKIKFKSPRKLFFVCEFWEIFSFVVWENLYNLQKIHFLPQNKTCWFNLNTWTKQLKFTALYCLSFSFFLTNKKTLKLLYFVGKKKNLLYRSTWMFKLKHLKQTAFSFYMKKYYIDIVKAQSNNNNINIGNIINISTE